MAVLVTTIHVLRPQGQRCTARALAPGLVQAIDALHDASMRGGWVYIMTNRPNGTLYTGVTNDIARRSWEHREGRIKGFTKRHGLKRLVLTEFYEDIRDALQRESNMKHWSRAWKVRLIVATNPEWRDLYEDLNK
jgi:putative endonuclease